MDHLDLEQEDFGNQQERLEADFGYTEREAVQLFETTKTYVMLQSEEAGLEYSTETVDAMTNVLVAVLVRTRRREQLAESKHMTEIAFRFLALLVLFSILLGIAHGLNIGLGLVPLAILGVMLIIAIRANIVSYED